MTCKTRQEFEDAKERVELISGRKITNDVKTKVEIQTTVDDWLE